MVGEISLVRIQLADESKESRWVCYAIQILFSIIGAKHVFVTDLEAADIYYGDSLPVGFRGLYIPSAMSCEILKPQDLDALRLNGDVYSFQQDILAYCFSCLSGELESQRDDCGVPICASATPAEAFAFSNPVIHMVAEQICKSFRNLNRGLEVLPLWPDNKKMALLFTHDVDAPFSCIKLPFRTRLLKQKISERDVGGIIRAIIGLVKRLAQKVVMPNYGTRKDPQLGFRYWAAIEKTIGARPTFFLATKSASEIGADFRDVTYDFDDKVILQELLNAVDEGAEVGLHGSINSKRSVGALREELDRLRAVLKDVPVTSIRNHFWSVSHDPELTLQNHQSAGLEVDSTFGLNDSPGFRRGICVPFFAWSRLNRRTLDILSVSNTCMDGGIFYSEDCVELGVEKLRDHILSVRKYSGAAVLNWHLEQSSKTRLNGAGEALSRFITSMSKDQQEEIYFCTLTELADWWSKRMSILEISDEKDY